MSKEDFSERKKIKVARYFKELDNLTDLLSSRRMPPRGQEPSIQQDYGLLPDGKGAEGGGAKGMKEIYVRIRDGRK